MLNPIILKLGRIADLNVDILFHVLGLICLVSKHLVYAN